MIFYTFIFAKSRLKQNNEVTTILKNLIVHK